MKTKLYKLCDERKVFIPSSELAEFKSYANSNGVNPSGGIAFDALDPHNPMPGTDCQLMYLDDPVTKEEALVIADHHHLKGEVERLINTGFTPFDALREWDL